MDRYSVSTNESGRSNMMGFSKVFVFLIAWMGLLSCTSMKLTGAMISDESYLVEGFQGIRLIKGHEQHEVLEYRCFGEILCFDRIIGSDPNNIFLIRFYRIIGVSVLYKWNLSRESFQEIGVFSSSILPPVITGVATMPPGQYVIGTHSDLYLLVDSNEGMIVRRFTPDLHGGIMKSIAPFREGLVILDSTGRLLVFQMTASGDLLPDDDLISEGATAAICSCRDGELVLFSAQGNVYRVTDSGRMALGNMGPLATYARLFCDEGIVFLQLDSKLFMKRKEEDFQRIPSFYSYGPIQTINVARGRVQILFGSDGVLRGQTAGLMSFPLP